MPPAVSGPTFLVTGGAGFIGSHFVDHLIHAEPGCRIVVADRLTYAGSLDNLSDAMAHPGFGFVQADVADAGAVGPLVAEADYVVNFAAETHVDRSIAGCEEFARTDVVGVAVLLEAFREAGRGRMFLQVSTDEVYGEIMKGAADEDAPLAPRNPYAASKAGADLLVLAFAATHGIPVAITRGANTYGPRQHREKMVPTFMAAAARGEPLPVYGDGRQVRDWLYVGDHCRAIARVLRDGDPGGVYNVGTGRGKENLAMARRILELAARDGAPPGRIAHVADRPGHDRRYAVRTSRLRALGWAPETSLAAGLEATWESVVSASRLAAVG